MKKVILGIIFLFFIASSGYCQNATQAPGFTIQSDKHAYKEGEIIRITATLTNNSDKEIIVYWNNEEPSLINSIGDTPVPEYIIWMPTNPVDNVETIHIQPNQFVQRELSVRMDTLGRAKLTLKYTFPNVTLDGGASSDQGVWEGDLISDPITVDVEK